MRIRQHMSHIVLIIFLTVLCGAPAAGQQVGEVPNVESSHSSDSPSRDPRIRMTWDIPEGDPYAYYVLFDTNPEHIFDKFNTGGVIRMPGTNFEQDFSNSDSDDVAYYFHIAAEDGEGNIGVTTSSGPYYIDSVPPRDVGITGPEITPTRNVTLTLEAAGASEMCVSNEGYGEGEWEDFAFSKEWELNSGPGEKTVYVRFRDIAWNIADASVVITLVPGDTDGNTVIELRDAVLALQVLCGADTGHVSSDADMDGNGRIGTEEVIYVLRRVSGRDCE